MFYIRPCIGSGMEGGALSVRCGNGIEVSGAGLSFHLDPRSLSIKKVPSGTVCCTSHAHSDHIPSSFERKGPNRIVASEFTRRFISEIKGRAIEAEHCDRVRLHDAGHVTGSVMFEMDVEGQKVLYTGDFSPRDRFRIKGARPVKVDVLLTEATFGKPQYVFPPTDRIFKVMTDWIEDSLSQGFSVALFTSSNLGKTHELIHALRDLEPRVHGTISESSRLLQRCGLDLEIREHSPGDVSSPCVLIGAHGNGMTEEIMTANRKGRRFRKASVSGWAANGNKRGYVDEQFAISDHADHDELLAFVKACSPRMVYVEHGYASELAGEIRQKLGIDACPVPSAGQQCLLNY
jgi:putative mRNA 3-end processing factor